MLGIFCALLIVVWAVIALTAFCPLRAIRRRRREAELNATLKGETGS